LHRQKLVFGEICRIIGLFFLLKLIPQRDRQTVNCT